MNRATMEGKWNELRGKVQEQWGKLTDDDLDQIQGKRTQLLGRIQERYGKAREDVENEVNAWERRNGLR